MFTLRFAFSKVSVVKSLRFQSAFLKVSVYAAEQCERKVKTDTFYPFSLESRAMKQKFVLSSDKILHTKYDSYQQKGIN